MANVNIKFNNKDYLLSCEDGQEENLVELANHLNSKYTELNQNLGNIGENKLLLITAIKMVDDYFDLFKKVKSSKNDFQELSNKFNELKTLTINYKDEKELEIEKLKNELNEFKIKVEKSRSSYEEILDKTTKSIEKFIKNTEIELDKNVQLMKYDKTFLRNKSLLLRKKKYLTVRKFNYNLIFGLIRKHFYRKKITIGGYYPSNYEVNILKFLEEASKKKFKITLPVIQSSNKMSFHSWIFREPLYVNQFGKLEPKNSKIKIIPDIIMVPLVAFDDRLNRIGYGKGYYDRSLRKLVK